MNRHDWQFEVFLEFENDNPEEATKVRMVVTKYRENLEGKIPGHILSHLSTQLIGREAKLDSPTSSHIMNDEHYQSFSNDRDPKKGEERENGVKFK